ncbi:hypothetical protein HDE_14037 [Halotydeus destructor]|nr:hypothetical protein HDE_14037 [Halotydeus destructor]
MEQDIVLSLIQELIVLQDERVYMYDLFNEGHKIYLCTGPNYDLNKFKVLVQDITQELKRISNMALKIESRIRPHHPELANLILSLEQDEKQNLMLIARLQLAKKDLKDHPNDSLRINAVSALKQQLKVYETKIRQLVDDIRYVEVAEAY